MEPSGFIGGMIIGLVTCAPIGPVGLFCVRRTLTYGRKIGVASLLGASTADGLYCAAACFGITFVSNFLEQKYVWVSLAGGMVLILLGIRIFLSQPQERGPKSERKGILGAYSSTFLLMLANPAPILVFTAALTALGIQSLKGDYLAAAVLVAGVFTGSAAWSPILIVLGTVFRMQYNPDKLKLVNKISGALIAGVGAALVLAHVWNQVD